MHNCLRFTRAVLILLLLALASFGANAYVEPPRIAPEHPRADRQISLLVKAGICHGFFDATQGFRQVVRNGNQIDVIIEGSDLYEGHPFCISPEYDYAFAIGTLPPGEYTARILLLDSGLSPTPTDYGSVSFTVSDVQSIPAASAAGIVLAVFLITGLAWVARRQVEFAGLVLIAGLAVVSPRANATAISVLLNPAPDAVSPEAVVDPWEFSSGLPPPLAAFALDSFVGAEYLLPRRAQGRLAQRLAANPTSPRAMLERYVVLHFADPQEIPQALASLNADPNVAFAKIVDDQVDEIAAGSPPGAVPSSQVWRAETGADEASSIAGGWGLVAMIDNGLATAHPSLAAFDAGGSYRRGGFLPALSTDVGRATAQGCLAQANCIDNDVDERQPFVLASQSPCNVDGSGFALPVLAGHGTHVAGLISANPIGTTPMHESCRNCGLSAWRITNNTCQGNTVVPYISPEAINVAVTLSADSGIQVSNQSFGRRNITATSHCTDSPESPECVAILHAHKLEVLQVAAAGNNRTGIQFPASNKMVLSVGGVGKDLALWDLSPNSTLTCPPKAQNAPAGSECGSNWTTNQFSGRHQELVAPAHSVLSIFYPGNLECGARVFRRNARNVE